MQNPIIFSSDMVTQYGYIAIFTFVCLESFVFTGFLVPGVLVVIAAGFLTQQGLLSTPLVITLSIIAILLGDTASYFLGRIFGPKLVKIPERVKQSASKNWWFLLFYHHVPLSRMFIPAFFGMQKSMPFLRWFTLDTLSAIFFVLTYFSIGYYASYYAKEMGDIYKQYNFYIILFGFLLLIVWSIQIIKKRKEDITNPATEKVKYKENNTNLEQDSSSDPTKNDNKSELSQTDENKTNPEQNSSHSPTKNDNKSEPSQTDENKTNPEQNSSHSPTKNDNKSEPSQTDENKTKE